MEGRLSSDLLDTFKVTDLATSEARNILMELDLQSEKLIGIQKISGESNGLLFLNHRLIDNSGKGLGARYIIIMLAILLLIFLSLFIKLKFF